MNISFFLTPKKDVVCGLVTSTMRQIIEKMEYHRYTAIPLLDEEGKYVGTITEGDLLWKLKADNCYDSKKLENISLRDVPRHITNVPVSIEANIEDLILASTTQNFVPVVDDQGIFIGIIKRSDIITYCYQLIEGQGLMGKKTSLRAGA
ncbi:CBS domain-containing protein [Alkaliphilus serpentinus]|uniref:CBS domain-containing protein n=1 Tax=Alkaliphilus serpentinus TaxID=1482731 RepID=A0A833M7S0_9FIRM|nr:CBS domain-containing protein [Alkaliphilus serpentinus]KAB3531163.1 CBS domain-containing protein [Alkaliphilus serpentinus]